MITQWWTFYPSVLVQCKRCLASYRESEDCLQVLVTYCFLLLLNTRCAAYVSVVDFSPCFAYDPYLVRTRASTTIMRNLPLSCCAEASCSLASPWENELSLVARIFDVCGKASLPVVTRIGGSSSLFWDLEYGRPRPFFNKTGANIFGLCVFLDSNKNMFLGLLYDIFRFRKTSNFLRSCLRN